MVRCPFGPLTSEKLVRGLEQSKQGDCWDGESQGKVRVRSVLMS